MTRRTDIYLVTREPCEQTFICYIAVFFPDESGDVGGDTGFTGGAGSENCQTPDGAAGICTLLPQCPVLFDLLSIPSPASLNYLRQSICGYKVLDPEVILKRISSEMYSIINMNG